MNLVHIAGQTYLVDVGFGGKFYTQNYFIANTWIRERPDKTSASCAWTIVKMGIYRDRAATGVP